ncbi:MAG: endonuclease/exonuclease/phosphatase family protein [Candidatus Marinimicrobia bacterium]|nr:endonuclease/exonuclease/phosphatase family protein [Candidatus Neomarinimicrobiota bacterium]
MTRILIVPFLVIFIISCAEDKELDTSNSNINLGADSTFDIVTWNIENFPKHSSTIDYLLELIPLIEADIIALQEMDSEIDFQYLVRQLENYGGMITNSASYNINLALLYSNNIDVEDTYEIFTDDWWSFPRSPLVAQVHWNGKEIFVINNHFKANESGTEDEARRKSASENLEDYINEYLPNKNVIILGDLNDELNEDANENVFQNFINAPTYFQFTDMDIALGSESYWSYPTWPSHLDHILITNELFDEFENEGSFVQTIRLEEYFDNGWTEYEKYISDHRPVGLSLKFNP